MAWIFGNGGGGGGGSSSNASVGPTGAPAPTSATEIGIIVAGNLVGVSVANPIPVSGSFSGAVEISDGTHDMGLMADFGSTPGAVYALNVNASLFAGTTALTETGGSLDVNITGGGGGTQYTDETAETAGAFEITVAGMYNGTDVVGLRSDASNNLLVNLMTALPNGSNLIGQIEVSDGTNVLFTSIHAAYVQFPAAQHVIVDSGGVTQYTDETPETAGAFIGTVALAYNGTDVVGLRTDASNNLLVNIAAGGGGTIGSIDYSKDSARFSSAQVNISSAGTTQVIAYSGSTVIRVYRLLLVVGGNAPGTIAIGEQLNGSGAVTTLFPAMPVTPYQSIAFDLDAEPYVTSGAGYNLVLVVTGVTAVTGMIWYTQV